MYWNGILSDFKEQILEVQELSDDNLGYKASKGIFECQKTLNRLKNKVEERGFVSEIEEIDFFKYDKMEPMRFLIYFTEVRSTELRLPKIGKERQKKYLEKQINKVNRFFEKNTDFLLYMEQGLTHFDELYFTRKNQNNRLLVKSYPYFKDPIFNTSHDGIWAKIKAMGLYVHYLQKRIKMLEEKERIAGECKKLKWTGSYAALVEMLYGCHEMGYFNNGNLPISKVMEAFGEFLNVDKANHSRTYNEIKNRKSSRIKFFERTGNKLLEKMDKEDGIE